MVGGASVSEGYATMLEEWRRRLVLVAPRPSTPCDLGVAPRQVKPQKGRTITRMTTSTTITAGTSLSIRSCLPVSVGFPAASFFA
jgi:hypothetical protein